MLRYVYFSALILFSTAFCDQTDNVNAISEALGHRIGKYLESLGVQVDLDLVVKGLQGEKKGDDSPMTDDECIAAISELQDKLFERQSECNLVEADKFLSENAEKEDIVEIETKKLQYKILKEGKGSQVQLSDAPLIKYTGKYLNGSVFGQTMEPEIIELSETIAGFKKGVLGMKEGEKRLLFIHPTLGYGKDHLTEPNSLLVFEVEIVKTNGLNKPDKFISESPDLKKGIR
ncbi:MAG: FKBP-type peptidyl-prolyl cis-trans isomerase [Chlamydiota bacterium]|jgi:peptidylprolyl isomerase